MTTDDRALLIWATRGRSWGFRFLLDGGFADPLPEYERAFDGISEASKAWSLRHDVVAVRFTDPLTRRDASGRVIPHEFAIYGRLADQIGSVDDAIRLVWPLVDDVYGRLWDRDSPPTKDDVLR